MATVAEGARDLELLGKRLKETGRGDLRKELLKGIRHAAKPAINDVRASARSELPQRGGLAELVARSSFSVRSRLAGDGAGVRITGTGRSVKALRALNAGRLRHPAFGQRDTWVEQVVQAGWFDKPIEARADNIRQEIDGVLHKIARDIERGI